jgi:branched-chain amino acid transport system substrate-binding protein
MLTAGCRVLVLWAVTWAAAAQTPIVIHHIGPLTGVLAASNQEALAGAQLYLDAFNVRGGVQGRPVVIERLDDGQDPARAVKALDALIEQRKVLALVLVRTTPGLEAMLPALTKNGIAVVGPQTGASMVNQPPKREIFTLRASYRAEAEAAIRQQHAIGVRSLGLLLADDAFGRDVLAGVEPVMKELQITPVAIAKVDNRKPDVTAAVQQMLAKSPQAVLLVSGSKAAADFGKAYRAQGGRSTFISLSNTSNTEYVQALGAQGYGAIVMQVMPSPFNGGTALAREFAAAAAQAQPPQPLSYAGQYGFASAKLLTLGLLRAGNAPTSASLIQALEGLGEVDLGGLRVRYGPGERTGSRFIDSTLITRDGKFMR